MSTPVGAAPQHFWSTVLAVDWVQGDVPIVLTCLHVTWFKVHIVGGDVVLAFTSGCCTCGYRELLQWIPCCPLWCSCIYRYSTRSRAHCCVLVSYGAKLVLCKCVTSHPSTYNLPHHTLMCVCVCVCVYVCTCVCTCVCVCVCTFVYMCVYMHLLYVCICARVCVSLCAYVCVSSRGDHMVAEVDHSKRLSTQKCRIEHWSPISSTCMRSALYLHQSTPCETVHLVVRCVASEAKCYISHHTEIISSLIIFK